MSDDLDEQILRAMKVLDDEVPPGYFEGLPQRTLARLEDGIMQTSSDSSSNRNSSPASSPVVVSPMSQKERDEDSGLHDIRSLASSAKARLSSRRSTQNPVVSEDDILASSSAGWKAVALPEPAKMVSLPELASLPTKSEIETADRAAREKLKAELKAEKKTAAAAPATAVDAPAASMSDVPSIGSRIAAQPSGGKGKMIAFIGLGVAAAAGAALYFAMGNKDKAPAAAVAETRALPQAPELTSTSKELPTKAAPPTVEPIVTPPAAPEPPAVAAVAPAETEAAKPAAKATKEPKEKVHKVEIRDTVNTAKNEKPVAAVVAPKEEVKKPGGGEEPSFDALLKEAGVSDAKKEAKPTLDKKSLSGADIKAGMSSVAGKAQACYAGTQGTAAVKLTVAPSGQVQKVTVTGVFAGTPVASCVESAVKSATFPAWDGGPQSIAYSYLLAE
jgi:outer membrane biosynthesis protein TonB